MLASSKLRETMKVFGELTIQLKNKLYLDLVAEIERKLTEGWTRNVERETEVWSRSQAKSSCFRYAGTDKASPTSADLWLHNAGQHAYVSNIVPAQQGRLSYDEYNTILRTFWEQLAQPAAEILGLRALLSKTDVEIEDLLSKKAAEALQSFSANANKSTGSSHPLDKQRWNEFLITCHRKKDRIGTDLLSKWLMQDGWDEESASDLVIQFEQGTGLLEQYDTTEG